MVNVAKINKKLARVCKKLNCDALNARLYLCAEELVILGFDDWYWCDLVAFKNKLERRGFVVDVFAAIDGDPSPETPVKSFEDFYKFFELVREKYILDYVDDTIFTASDVAAYRAENSVFYEYLEDLDDDAVRVEMALEDVLEDVAEPLEDDGRLFFECGSWFGDVSLRVKKCSKKTSKLKSGV